MKSSSGANVNASLGIMLKKCICCNKQSTQFLHQSQPVSLITSKFKISLQGKNLFGQNEEHKNYDCFYFRLYTLSNDVNVFTGDVEGNFDSRNRTLLTIAIDEFYDRLQAVSFLIIH
jgi:hypothetical protein